MKSGINENACRMENKIDGVNKEMKAEMNGNALKANDQMKKMQGEMQQMGGGLQAGMKAMAGELIMATPHAGANKLRGSATAVRPTREAGTDQFNLGDVLGEKRGGDGKSDGDTRGKTKWGDGDVHETRRNV